jgi:hypothetical protein
MVFERIFLPIFQQNVSPNKEAKASEQSENEREYYIPTYSHKKFLNNPG